MLLDAIILVLFPLAMAFAASSDLVSMTISNRLQMALVAMFALAAASVGMPLEQLGMHVVACLAVLIPCFYFFARGWMGGGDAKLAAVIALWFGWNEYLVQFLLIASVYGAFVTLGILWFRNQILPQFVASQGWVLRLHHPKTGIPYGIAIAAGALSVFPMTAWMNLAVMS